MPQTVIISVQNKVFVVRHNNEYYRNIVQTLNFILNSEKPLYINS